MDGADEGDLGENDRLRKGGEGRSLIGSRQRRRGHRVTIQFSRKSSTGLFRQRGHQPAGSSHRSHGETFRDRTGSFLLRRIRFVGTG